MSGPPPIRCTWEGDGFKPLPQSARLCDKLFVVGEVYTLVQHEHRSAASQGHYFAAVHEAWVNLPEHHAERFPTDEHLRKYAMVKAGFRDERTIVAGSKAEAQRIAALARTFDEFAIVTVADCVVTIHTAKSQSRHAMAKAEFQRSKEAVLGVLAEMVGVTPGDLSSNAGRAA